MKQTAGMLHGNLVCFFFFFTCSWRLWSIGCFKSGQVFASSFSSSLTSFVFITLNSSGCTKFETWLTRSSGAGGGNLPMPKKNCKSLAAQDGSAFVREMGLLRHDHGNSWLGLVLEHSQTHHFEAKTAIIKNSYREASPSYCSILGALRSWTTCCRRRCPFFPLEFWVSNAEVVKFKVYQTGSDLIDDDQHSRHQEWWCWPRHLRFVQDTFMKWRQTWYKHLNMVIQCSATSFGFCWPNVP